MIHVGKADQDKGAHRHRYQHELPRHGCADHQEGVDPGRRMESIGELHCPDAGADRQGGKPRIVPEQLEYAQPAQRRQDMTADDVAGLRLLAVWRRHHQDDRGRKGHDQQRKAGQRGQSDHGADAEAAADGGDDGAA